MSVQACAQGPTSQGSTAQPPIVTPWVGPSPRIVLGETLHDGWTDNRVLRPAANVRKREEARLVVHAQAGCVQHPHVLAGRRAELLAFGTQFDRRHIRVAESQDMSDLMGCGGLGLGVQLGVVEWGCGVGTAARAGRWMLASKS